MGYGTKKMPWIWHHQCQSRFQPTPISNNHPKPQPLLFFRKQNIKNKNHYLKLVNLTAPQKKKRVTNYGMGKLI